VWNAVTILPVVMAAPTFQDSAETPGWVTFGSWAGDFADVVLVSSPPEEPLPPEADRFLGSLTFKPIRIKIKRADATPEDALRTFFLAWLARDEGSLRAVTLGHSEIAWLLKGPSAPPQSIRQMEDQLRQRPIQRLKPGDRVTLPDKRTFVVDRAAVDENHVVLRMSGDPTPYNILQFDGHWKVWAEPAIAARKAAEAARQEPMARGR